MQRKTRFITVCTIAIILFCIIANQRTNNNSEIAAIREKIATSKHIIHATGAVSWPDGNWFTYSNSHEGMQNCLANGQNIIEVDFLTTTDNYLICAHDWNRLYINGENVQHPISLSEALTAKVYYELTPLWLGDIVNYLQENPELYIVTDTKDDGSNLETCKLISSFCPELMDRFIIQIYHEEEYNPIAQLGFKNIIFTLYKTGESERKSANLINIANKYPLIGYTFPQEFINDKDFFDGIKLTGLPLYVHTVNEIDTQQQLFEMGISAVYTDEAVY